MGFRVSAEALKTRSEYNAENAKSRGPTILQRFLSLLIPLLFFVSLLPVYIVVAGNGVLSVIYYAGVGVTILVNVVIVSEIVGSICWHRRCSNRLERTSRKLGSHHTAVIISAFLPNEPLDSLEATMKTMTLLQRQEKSQLTIIMGHNGGSPVKVKELEEVIRKVRTEIDPKDAAFVEIIGLHHKFSKSKAENVNGSINYLQSMGPVKPEVVALYDADHQPHSSSMLIACAELEASESDVVQGRCIIRSGSWIIGLEFDVMYAIFHSGGRILRGFGLFGGTNGFWRNEVLHKIKMNPGRLTEDIDSGIRALRGGYQVTYNPMILSYEEAPPSFGALAKQRMRWSQGWAEVSATHISAAFERNPSLSIRRRIHLFLVLQFREIFPYIVIHAFMACIVYVSRSRKLSVTGIGILFVFLTTLAFLIPTINMIVSYYLTRSTHINFAYNVLHRMGFVVVALPYELFKSALAIWGHGRSLLGISSWNVTSRVSSTDSKSSNSATKESATDPSDLSSYEEDSRHVSEMDVMERGSVSRATSKI